MDGVSVSVLDTNVTLSIRIVSLFSKPQDRSTELMSKSPLTNSLVLAQQQRQLTQTTHALW
jgi:hypothetical protein